MPSSIFLPDKVAAALDRDVLAAWARTDRPTAQALIAAGLPVPLEVTDGAPAASLARYTAAGLRAELAGADVIPREWLKATAILALTALIFRVMGSDPNALLNLSALPAMAGAYTLAIAGVTWGVRTRRLSATLAALGTARNHLTTAEPVGPSMTLIVRIRDLRRAVVEATLSAAIQGALLRELFDLEAALSTTGTIPAEATSMIDDIAEKLARAHS
ncbi:MAG: hypothetical protein P8R54_25860 [Myxococcota bacterium]|nr:hypothetical protein [Myxococcota bacterium]